MKRFVLLFLTSLFAAGSYAQSLPASGFYRIKNVKSGRYITIIDNYGALDIKGKKADLSALRTFPDINKQTSNPGSVIYMKYENSDHFDLQGQGTGARDIVGYPIQVHANNDGPYWAYASSNGVSLYLKEVYDEWSEFSQMGEYGMLMTAELSATDKSFKFDIIPLSSSNNDNYFGLNPDVTVGSASYKSFYVGFAFKTVSPGMNVYYVSTVDKAKAVAVYEEITGTVPAATPVFVKCSSTDQSANRLDFTYSSPAAVSGNQLQGVYFCNTPDEASSEEHRMFVEYDESTMRVLGKTSGGQLGFIKAPNSALFIEGSKKYIPANTAYLKVDASTPAELTLVSKSEYEAGSAVTVTARSYTRVYGDANPTFEYDASGTLNGTPLLTCEATATSPVGTYPIKVSQGSVTGATVNGVAGTLTITPAPLTVKANDASREYGEANPAFTVTYSGWKNGETDAVLTTKPTATTTADAKTAAGTAAITVSGGAATNYDFTYANGTLTITKAPLTAKADDKSRPEGTENPELTISYSGFKNSETADVLDTKPTATTTATKDSPAGTYPITVSGGSAKNYALNYQNGTLTVQAGSLKITAKNYTREYGEENPTFEYDVTGTATLHGTPAISCAATKESPIGTYDIIVSRGTVENENVTYVKGTLTITAAKLTVAANDATREYGDENPTFTVKYSGWKNGDTETVLTTKPTATTAATKATDAGTAAITVAGGAATNYVFDYVVGTLTITKATLTVKAENASREEGQANPEFQLTYSGWKNSDNEAVLTKKPTATTDADEKSEPGEYTITVSGGEATNYNFSYVNGKLTVTAKATIQVEDKDNDNIASYEVLDEGTVTFTGVEPTDGTGDVSEVVIPETITSGDTEYTVTEIAAGAFEDMTSLVTVTIPETIQEIGADAFAGCTALAELYVYVEEPIDLTSPATSRGHNGMTAGTVDDPVFRGVNKEVCKLYVPYGCKAKYESAPVWKEFKNIIEMDEQGIAIVTIDTTDNGEIYSLSGQKMMGQTLTKGIYILRGRKIVVK